MSHDDYRALDFPGADEAGNMLQYYTEFADYFTAVARSSRRCDLGTAALLPLNLQRWRMNTPQCPPDERVAAYERR